MPLDHSIRLAFAIGNTVITRIIAELYRQNLALCDIYQLLSADLENLSGETYHIATHFLNIYDRVHDLYREICHTRTLLQDHMFIGFPLNISDEDISDYSDVDLD